MRFRYMRRVELNYFKMNSVLHRRKQHKRGRRGDLAREVHPLRFRAEKSSPAIRNDKSASVRQCPNARDRDVISEQERTSRTQVRERACPTSRTRTFRQVFL